MMKIKELFSETKLPRTIIALFLLLLFCLTPFAGIRVDQSIENVISRFGMFSNYEIGRASCRERV